MFGKQKLNSKKTDIRQKQNFLMVIPTMLYFRNDYIVLVGLSGSETMSLKERVRE